MTREEFANTDWNMTYEEQKIVDCSECGRELCPHRFAYRRVPEIDGGLGLCPRHKEERK